jgi:hypothetical protein
MDSNFVVRRSATSTSTSTSAWKLYEAQAAWGRLGIPNVIKHIDRAFYNLKFGKENWKIQIGKDWSSGVCELQVEIWVRMPPK